ncbi:MAG: tetratricopeptide repeat protein [Candidatus Hydrogenedentes bacterium]|nr:tetratricopeptide repeat protein [Candidatus Hydrogenedentota bacterium]
MKRKTVIILAVLLASVVAIGAVAVGGAFLYLEYRNRAWLHDALAAYDNGEWARAKGLLERYLPQDPKNSDLLLKYADACSRLTEDRIGSLRAAATAYQQILWYHPGRDDVRQKMVDLNVKLSAWSTLEYFTRDWLRRAPGNADYLYYSALALDRMGKIDEAMAGYEALIQNNTDRSDVYGNYARLLRDKELETKAEEVFASARAARPDDGRIVADYARFLARKSTWSEVQTMLDESLELSPNDPDVLVAAAQADLLRRQYASAIEHLRNAIQAKPDEGPIYLMLASAYVYQGMMEDAIKALKQADVFVRIDTPVILITLADLQLGMSAFEDAKATIAEYSAAYPDQLPISEYFTAKELLVRGEPSEAVKRLASVTQLRPGFALAEYTLAEAYLATGEIELARNALETYLSKNPTDVRAQRLMAQRFGRPVSIEMLASRAQDLAKQSNPDRQLLVTTAAALLDSAVRRDAIAEYNDNIRAALEKAIETDPAAPMPYRILADLWLLQDRPGEATAVIDKAISQGCDPTEFLLMRASAALVANDPEAAAKIIDEATADASLGHSEYAQWATFFAQHGFYEQAMAMLERGIGRLGESEARVSLEVERAALALRHGELAKAAQWLDECAPRVNSGTTLRRRLNAARLQLAQTYLVTDPSQQAEQDAQRLVHAVRQEDPGNAMLQVSDGLMLLRRTPPELDRAQNLFENAVAMDTSAVGAHWGLAKVALARLDYPRALTHIERAMALAPNVSALRLLEADALLNTDRLFEAERVIRRILEDDPADPAAWQMLVTCLLQRGARNDATAAFGKLEALVADDPAYAESLRALRGALLVARGEDGAAEEPLRAEYAAHPDDLETLKALASVVMRQGREDEARNLVTAFAEGRSEDPAVWVALAQWWAKTESESRWREASTCLTRALLADPNYIPAIRAMLAVRLRQEDNLEALSLCNRYLSRNPDDADMLNTRARLLGQINGRLQEALASADRAIELDDRPEYKGTRGVILVAMRQYERALRDLRPYALETEEVPAQFDVALAEAYFATNELELARQHLDKARAKAGAGEVVDARRLDQLQEAIQRKEAAA